MSVQTVRAHCALPDSPLAKAAAGLDACVHCGFCLQACPTYLVLQDENDSPRGRLVLMRALLDGDAPPDDPDVTAHLDRCLGCRGCETACPSGVPYGHLLEAARATLREHGTVPLVVRVVLGVFRRRPLLALALAGARLFRLTRIPALLARVPGRLGFAMGMLASSADGASMERPHAAVPRTAKRGTATLLRGCVMDGLFAHTHRATERALAVNGWTMTPAPGQGCCGALHAHAGDLEGARALAKRNIAAFEKSPADRIVVNAAGCGAMLKEYAHLLADEPAWRDRAAAVAQRARDVSEVLVESGPVPAGPLDVALTYDAPCHLSHAQRVVAPPLQVLDAVRGAKRTVLTDADLCCGSAGIYNLVEPETSDRVLEAKLERIGETGAPVVATGNPGCHMQIGAGLRRRGERRRVVHPVEVLDAAYGSDGGR